jgi:TadE-like protein
MPLLRSTTGERRRGNAYVEFALVFLLMLTLLVGAFEFTWVLFVRATFHHAVREAVRAAITANPPAAYSGQFDNYLKEVIHHNTLGLLSGSDLDAHVDVQYFNPNCSGPVCPIATAAAGSVVQVSIRCFKVYPVSSLIQARDPGTGQLVPFSINVSSSDRMEPFPGTPPTRGTVANPTAYNTSTGQCN